ncbi:MAG: peptide chain release factor N(5)-glutamine methyltransferase [Deltaproteobacteria bacterium]|nr:peptide chain release factor N(5)-glutamine methyltransferase [Deltaproteobacteria bacterium]
MPEPWTILKLIKWTADYLGEKGIDTPRLDGELLLAHSLKMDRTHLYMNFDKPLNEDELAAFRGLVKRRAAREPLQYITGHQEFWSMEFKVSPSVLIPRPETELLVEEGAKAVKASFPECSAPEILDVGSGSGALTAALAKAVNGAHVTGVDISPEAVSLARENVESNGLSSSVTILEGDLFAPVADKLFHLIVSNPPYIPRGDLQGLQAEVSDFEPLSALDGGNDGLDFYRAIVHEAPQHLHPGGSFMVEHGEGQREAIAELFRNTGRFEAVESLKDLAGIDRVVKGRRTR